MKRFAAAFSLSTLAMTGLAAAACEIQENGVVDMTGRYVCVGCSTLASINKVLRVAQTGRNLAVQAEGETVVTTMSIDQFDITYASSPGKVRNNCSTVQWSNGSFWLRIE